MSVVLSSQPNYKVTVAHYYTDPNPFVAYVQENSEADAIFRAFDTMEALDIIGGYVRNDFDTADGSPEHPNDYVETSFGWIQSDLLIVEKVTDMQNVCTVMTDVQLIPYLNGTIKPCDMNEDVYKLFLAFCDELADAHLNPRTCEAVMYDDKYVETENDGKLVSCKYIEF